MNPPAKLINFNGEQFEVDAETLRTINLDGGVGGVIGPEHIYGHFFNGVKCDLPDCKLYCCSGEAPLRFRRGRG